MADCVSRRGLLKRLASRDLLTQAARGIAPVWREVTNLTRPEPMSVAAAVATLRARKHGVAAAPLGAESGAAAAGAPERDGAQCPRAAEGTLQATAIAATGRP